MPFWCPVARVFEWFRRIFFCSRIHLYYKRVHPSTTILIYFSVDKCITLESNLNMKKRKVVI